MVNPVGGRPVSAGTSTFNLTYFDRTVSPVTWLRAHIAMVESSDSRRINSSSVCVAMDAFTEKMAASRVRVFLSGSPCTFESVPLNALARELFDSGGFRLGRCVDMIEAIEANPSVLHGADVDLQDMMLLLDYHALHGTPADLLTGIGLAKQMVNRMFSFETNRPDREPRGTVYLQEVRLTAVPHEQLFKTLLMKLDIMDSNGWLGKLREAESALEAWKAGKFKVAEDEIAGEKPRIQLMAIMTAYEDYLLSSLG